MNLSGSVAVITGGAAGLGLATAELFAEAGASVAIFNRNEEAGKQAERRLGPKAKFFAVDVADSAAVEAGVQGAVDHFGAIHICCNFAGIGIAKRIYGKSGLFPLEFLNQILATNLVGTFDVLRRCVERMAKNQPTTADGERGVIINTASAAAYEGQVGQAAYSASKGGVVAMTLPLARDLATLGIRVNTIVPGLIGTPPMMAGPDSVREPLIAQVQFPKRLGQPSEIARLAQHIVENVYLNGECIRLDGGIRMFPK